MFERFTDRGRRVMVLAQGEARLLNQDSIDTEHLLLGLLHEGEGVAARALEQFGISLETTRTKVEELVGAPSTAPDDAPPFSPHAKKVLELALREALQLQHNYIGTEHILLAVIREREGLGARALVDLGADLASIRRAVIGLLPGYPTQPGRPGPSPRVPRPPSRVVRYDPLLSSPSGSPPDCPRCQSSLETSARMRRLELVDEASATNQAFFVVYCDVCGQSLAFKPTD